MSARMVKGFIRSATADPEGERLSATAVDGGTGERVLRGARALRGARTTTTTTITIGIQ